jgi:hypothetical protein
VAPLKGEEAAFRRPLAMAARWPDVRNWGSTAAERQLVFPCDRHLPIPDDALYRAIDVDAPGPLLFCWLCQLRVAPYSYDWIDNFGRRSPRRLIPGLDALAVGQSVMGFELVAFERDRHLTLCGSPLGRAFGTYAVTYLVLPSLAQRCRLVVKLVAAYPRSGLLRFPMRKLGPVADLIMMRKQLLTLKFLAERDAPVAATT